MAMSSRERLLAALGCRGPDHVPCSFMLYGGLKDRCATYAAFVEAQLAMGLDAVVELPPRPPVVVNDYYNLHGLPVSYDSRVAVREWLEPGSPGQWPLLVKEYVTPAGTLRAEVRQTADWRWGDHVPFLDDYIEPRSQRFLVTGPEDLEPLRYLIVPPTHEEALAFHHESAPAVAQARARELLLAGGWGVGADVLGWLLGLQNLIYAVHDRPGFVQDFLGLVADWNRTRMSLILDAGVDLYIKRAWYENLDFWTPSSWRRFLLPITQMDAELAHSRGAKLGYIITSSCGALLPLLAEAGVDVVIGVDPREWDVAAAADQLGGRVCLWGGVNGHLTVEEGEEHEVRAEVRRAMEALAPSGGFVLSPVDNVRVDSERSRRNVAALIDEWKSATGRR